MSGAGFAPIFLVGCPRSGTTLLQSMLDHHPRVAVAPETFYVRRFWQRRKFFGDLRDDARLEHLAREIAGLPEFAEMELDGERFLAAAINAPRDHGALFEILLRQFAELRGKPLVAEKTPNHLLYMKTLARFFPAARFVHIVRDPRAVVSSWQSVPWSTGSIRGDAEVWRKYQRAARAQEPALAGRVHRLKYEDLLAAPERELANLCSFLAIPFDAAMTKDQRHDRSTVNILREPWKKDALGPLNAEAAAKWSDALAPAEVRTIEAIAGREMRRLGYRPRHGRLRLLPAAACCFVRREARAARRRFSKLLRRLRSAR